MEAKYYRFGVRDPGSWWHSVLHNLSHPGAVGEAERRHWQDTSRREEYRELWKLAPKWFKDEARFYLGKQYQARPKPKNLLPSEIFKAIEDASQQPR